MSSYANDGRFGYPDFPKFTAVSTGLRDAEEKLLGALKRRDQAAIATAKLDVMGALDEYGRIVNGLGTDLA